MPQNVASDQGLHSLLLIQQFLDTSTDNKMDIFIQHDKGFLLTSTGKKETLVMLNKDATPTSNFQPMRFLDPDYCYKFTYLMANSAEPDQKPADLDVHGRGRVGHVWV